MRTRRITSLVLGAATASALALAPSAAATHASDDPVHANGPSVTLTSGTQSDGVPWRLVGYRSNAGLCLDVAYRNGSDGAGACDFSLSATEPAAVAATTEWDRGQSVVYGPALPTVDRVRFRLEGEATFAITVTPQALDTNKLTQLGLDQNVKVFAASIATTKRVAQMDVLAAGGQVISSRMLSLETTWPPDDSTVGTTPPAPSDPKSVTHGTFAGSCSVRATMMSPDAWGFLLRRPYNVTGTATCTGTLDGAPTRNHTATVEFGGDLVCGLGSYPVRAAGAFRFDEGTSGDTTNDTVVDITGIVAREGATLDVSGSRSGRAVYNGSASGEWDCMTEGVSMQGELVTVSPLAG